MLQVLERDRERLDELIAAAHQVIEETNDFGMWAGVARLKKALNDYEGSKTYPMVCQNCRKKTYSIHVCDRGDLCDDCFKGGK